MIRFNEIDYNITYYEQKLGKDRLKSLENTLRLLGNFPNKEEIVAEYKENTQEPYSYLYEIKDLDNTNYKFYNFRLGDAGEIHRYSKNFYLFMQKEDSKFEYIYDFSWYDKKPFYKQLDLIEIKYSLSPNRNIRFKKDGHGNWCTIILEDGKKQYKIYLGSNRSNSLLEQLESIILKARQLDTFNMENVLNLIEDKKILNSCAIYEREELKAIVQFLNGEILSYEIKWPDKQIDVRVEDTITRTVKRDGFKAYKKEITQNYEIIQNEVKHLMKQL